MKIAKVYEPYSRLVKQTELMEGLGDTYSQNYDIRPMRRESLVDWWTKVLYRLDWCDNYGLPKCGGCYGHPGDLWVKWRHPKQGLGGRVWLFNMEANVACTYVQWPNKTPPLTLNAIGLAMLSNYLLMVEVACIIICLLVRSASIRRDRLGLYDYRG